MNASAPDRPTLLAEWLSELVYLAEGEGSFREVEALSISDREPCDLRAIARSISTPR